MVKVVADAKMVAAAVVTVIAVALVAVVTIALVPRCLLKVYNHF